MAPAVPGEPLRAQNPSIYPIEADRSAIENQLQPFIPLRFDVRIEMVLVAPECLNPDLPGLPQECSWSELHGTDVTDDRYSGLLSIILRTQYPARTIR